MSLIELIKNPLFFIPPEISHKLTIFALKNDLIFNHPIELPKTLNIKFFNSMIRTPIGIAAGFDKNAEVIKPLLEMGFGFVEVGTVTKNPQYGNKGKRIFRLIKDQALINRLGFNNKGINYLIRQINKNSLNNSFFGINIGINSGTTTPIQDYVNLIKEIYGLSNYIAINISSPNTKGLRNFHNKELLTELLQAISRTRRLIDYACSIPILLKVSPDISDSTKEDIVKLVLKNNINGLIISNTTIERKKLSYINSSNISGGLSGKPLFNLSTELLSEFYQLSQGKIIIIGCGGVNNAKDAYKKIQAGATLVQLYTAIVYQGFKLINRMNLELAEMLSQDGFNNVSEAVGSLYR